MHNMYEYTLRLNINNSVTDGCVRQERIIWNVALIDIIEHCVIYLTHKSLMRPTLLAMHDADTKYWMNPAELVKGWWSSLMKHGPFLSFFHATAWVSYSELSEFYLYADQVTKNFRTHPGTTVLASRVTLS